MVLILMLCPHCKQEVDRLIASFKDVNKKICLTCSIKPEELYCCKQAQKMDCVCWEAYKCPVHGEKHKGTHD
ncbi:MAG: hypothetical protein AABY22_12760 [Nanoarchaeota archaeon]